MGSRRHGDGLQEQRRRQDAVADRALLVRPGQPGRGRVEVDRRSPRSSGGSRVGQRDIRLAMARRIVTARVSVPAGAGSGRPRAAGMTARSPLGRCRLARSMSSRVMRPNRSRALDLRQVDAEVVGQPPQHGRVELLARVRVLAERRLSAAGTTTVGGSMAAACRPRRNDGERRPDGDPLAHRDQELLDHAALEDLHVDVGLVGVDDGDDVAAVHLVAWLHQPLDHRAGLHVGAERRHQELTHRAAPPWPRPRSGRRSGSAASSRCLA